MWVQLLKPRYIEMGGATRHYKKGDWVEVGRKQADYWISKGLAWTPDTFTLPDGCGIAAPTFARLPEQVRRLKVVQCDFELPHERTLIWDGSTAIDGRMYLGFQLLDTWQIAAPVCDYDTLASHLGSEEDRAKTKAVIRDLRVPLYDTRLIFVRRDADTERLFRLWKDDQGGDARLAFLRALYQVKPLILPLPTSWVR